MLQNESFRISFLLSLLFLSGGFALLHYGLVAYGWAFFVLLPELAAPPQLVLLDIGLPGLSGIEALPLLRRHLPQADFVMQTVFEDTDRIYQALCAGATGYLLKSTPPADIKAALLDVARGGANNYRHARAVEAEIRHVTGARTTFLALEIPLADDDDEFATDATHWQHYWQQERELDPAPMPSLLSGVLGGPAFTWSKPPADAAT